MALAPVMLAATTFCVPKTLLLGNAAGAGSGGITFLTGDPPVPQFSIADAPTNMIRGFTYADTIDITDAIASRPTATLGTGNVLSIPYATDSGTPLTLQLDPAANYAASDDLFLLVPDGGSGTDVLVIPTLITDESDLDYAIAGLDRVTSGSYTLTFANSFTDSVDPTAINLHSGVSLTIDGSDDTLDGGGHRGLFVYAGTVAVENLTIADAHAVGGAGGQGGGGGAGLGGGLFVAGTTAGAGAGGDVTLSNVSFVNDSATGGAGGTASASLGGGGLGGAGGTGAGAGVIGGGGGGVGTSGAGGDATLAGGVGIVAGANNGGEGGAGGGGQGGASGGGGGGGGTTGAAGGGGGGVDGENGQGSGPGAGHFGGGGGGGGATYAVGGAGGFGGGGGAGGDAAAGGAGGFGGGGGAGGAPGTGGFGGGAGTAGGGGGGLAAGGDIFVQQGGSLTIEGGSLSGGSVEPGAGAASAPGGAAYGSGIFLQGNETQTLAPTTGTTLTISGVIADESGSGGSGAGGLIIDGAGTVDLSAVNTFTGGITLDSGELVLGAAGAAGTGIITFGTGDPPTLAFTKADKPTNTIDGFANGNTIDITDLTTMSNLGTLVAGNVLDIPYTNGGGGTLTLQLDAGTDYSGDYFQLTSDGGSGTDVTIDGTPCYCRGTLILTDRGEVPVEDLSIGDRLVTRSGTTRPLRWIGTRSHSGRFAAGNQNILPVLIRQGALADGVPRRDLFVSPLHAMFLDGALIPAALLVNGLSVVQAASVELVEYFHLELDSHDVIQAEGALSETFVDDGSRGMFHNAADYHALYPDALPAPPRYCAPRVEAGEELGAVRRRLLARVRRPPATPSQGAALPPGPLLGHLDVARRDLIAGWAWDAHHPDAAVALEILNNGTVIARLAASDYRLDLESAGIGDGRHGFLLRIPGGLPPYRRHVIAVRRAADGAELDQSPAIVEPATGFDAEMERSLTGIVDGLLPGPERDRVLSFLVAQAERLQQCNADIDSQREDRLAWRHAQRRGGPTPLGAAIADPGLRALIIDDRLPDAARDGGSQAILSHARALRGLGYRVSLVAAHDMTPHESSVAALAAARITCWRAPGYASVEEVLRRQAGCFDVVYLHRVSMASAYMALARQHCPRARILYSVADLHHVRVAGQARIEGRPELLGHSRRLRQAECRAACAADAVLTHATQEADWLRRSAPRAKVHLVPWDQPLRPTAAPIAARRGVAFIGSYGHAPNADAARFLAEEIMPLVWRRDPDLPCILAGSDMPETIGRLAGPGLVTLGHVADLSEIFDRVRLTVAPLRYGAGVKSKVLASLAAGVPCVMSPVAAEGINLPPLLPGLVGATPTALAERIVRLHADTAANHEASRAGLALIKEDFAETRVQAVLQAAIEGTPLKVPQRLARFVDEGGAPAQMIEEHLVEFAPIGPLNRSVA